MSLLTEKEANAIITRMLNEALECANEEARPQDPTDELQVRAYVGFMRGFFYGRAKPFTDSKALTWDSRGYLAGLDDCFIALLEDKNALQDCLAGVPWPDVYAGAFDDRPGE